MLCGLMRLRQKRKDKREDEIITRVNPFVIGAISEYDSMNNKGLIYIDCFIKGFNFAAMIGLGQVGTSCHQE